MRLTKDSIAKIPLTGLGIFFCCVHAQAQPTPHIIRAEIVGNEIVDFDFVNSVVGWDAFFNSGYRGGSTRIGNLEAGQAWFGHEAFIRPPGAPSAFTTWQNPAMGAANQLDYHATTVAHILAGSGYVPTNGGSYTFAGLGMAPEAHVVTGGIATSFSNDPNNLGGFNTTTDSVVQGYKEFFRGTNIGKLDVINSSWGGSGDGAANSAESLGIDGLASQNLSTAHVVSAGNGGIAQVGAPANGHNNISVGSLGGNSYTTPSVYSSRGLADFYNPSTNTTHSGVRIAVDIAAPGEDFFLAAYLGNTGSIGAARPDLVQQPSPTGQYFTALSGTSYSAPIVAGGIALLKDAARTGLGESPDTHPDSFDTRTIKSVLMAGSSATPGWNNGQNSFNVTTQALDPVVGSGSLDLLKAANIYLNGTRDSNGGAIGSSGWALAPISLSQTVDYIFNTPFTAATSLTVALNWFADRGFEDATLGQDIAFANLDLEVWSLDGVGDFDVMVGGSQTTYNNTEFLRIAALSSGSYALRVRFRNMIYDTTNSIGTETFALAWTAQPIPEVHSSLLVALGFLSFLRRRSA